MKALEFIWNLFYWTAFGLCWAVLPFLMNYVDSGEFTIRGKLRSALYQTVKYYLIVLVLGLLFLIYLWWNNAFKK
jgi:hypothetical protein